MQLEPIITFRGMSPSPALEGEIRAHLAKLDTYYPRIMGARVLVELTERHHARGNHVHVRLDLTVPGEELVISHEATLHSAAQDSKQVRVNKRDELDREHRHAQVALRNAFETARRQLQDFARRQRGDVKRTVRQPRGRVVRLFPEDGYGFIQAADGHEVYFHRESVLGDAFDKLEVGTAVLFAEEPGEKGPQASTVKPARRRTAPMLTATAY